MLNKRGRPSFELNGDPTAGGLPTPVEQGSPSDESITLRATDLLVISGGVPSAQTDWAPFQHVKYDCTPFQEARVVACVASGANAGSVVGADFSTDDTTFSQMGASADVAVGFDVVGTRASDWQVLQSSCIGDCFFRWWTKGGDGSSVGKLGNVYLQFRSSGMTRRPLPPSGYVPVIFDTFQAYTDSADMDTRGYEDSPLSIPHQVEIIDMFWNGAPGTLASSGSCDGTQYVTWTATNSNFAGMLSGEYPKLTTIWARARIRLSSSSLGTCESITMLSIGRSLDSAGWTNIDVQLQGACSSSSPGLAVFESVNSDPGPGVVGPQSTIQPGQWMDVVIWGTVASPTTVSYKVWVGRTDGTGGAPALLVSRTFTPDAVTGSTPPTGPLGWGNDLEIVCTSLNVGTSIDVGVCNWEVVDGTVYPDPFGLL